jgi:ribonucleotide reductase beta subunit family protein with ferritin-like domain
MSQTLTVATITRRDLRKKNRPEPLLTPNPRRFALFPIHDKDIWAMYKRAESCFWTAEEVTLTQDIEDFQKLDEPTKRWLELVLAQFSQADEIVGENLVNNFSSEVQLPEARSWYGMQTAIENIHSEMYSLLIDAYVKDETKKEKLFNAIEHYPSVKLKANWCMKWMDASKKSFNQRLIAFACVEMIFFSTSFAAIFYIKKKGLMPGLTFSNSLISRDEAMHCEFACLLYSKLVNKVPTATIHDIIKEAVDIEIAFVIEALGAAEGSTLVNMDSNMMSTYVKYVADFLCDMLSIPRIYNVENPLAFMKLQSFVSFTKTSFFERRVAEYSLAGVCDKDASRLTDDLQLEVDF